MESRERGTYFPGPRLWHHWEHIAQQDKERPLAGKLTQQGSWFDEGSELQQVFKVIRKKKRKNEPITFSSDKNEPSKILNFSFTVLVQVAVLDLDFLPDLIELIKKGEGQWKIINQVLAVLNYDRVKPDVLDKLLQGVHKLLNTKTGEY